MGKLGGLWPYAANSVTLFGGFEAYLSCNLDLSLGRISLGCRGGVAGSFVVFVHLKGC